MQMKACFVVQYTKDMPVHYGHIGLDVSGDAQKHFRRTTLPSELFNSSSGGDNLVAFVSRALWLPLTSKLCRQIAFRTGFMVAHVTEIPVGHPECLLDARADHETLEAATY